MSSTWLDQVALVINFLTFFLKRFFCANRNLVSQQTITLLSSDQRLNTDRQTLCKKNLKTTLSSRDLIRLMIKSDLLRPHSSAGSRHNCPFALITAPTQ